MKRLILYIAILMYTTISTYSQNENKTVMDGNIASLEDLIWLSENPDVWDENWVLTADIDASETAGMNGGLGFSPLGDSPSEFGVRQQVSFTGTFDGQGHVISNITINRPNEPYVGFFGHIEGGSILNLGLENISVNGYRYVGGFVGYLTQSGSISNSFSIGDIEATEYTGGFVGITYSNNTITDSYSEGSVQTDKWGGGFVGDNYTNTTISNCYTKSVVNGVDYLGGFAGNNRWFSNIYNSYSTGDVTGSGWYIGGFVGDNSESRIENSFSTGSATGTYGTGGFAGHNFWMENDEMGIFNCYSTGSVSGSAYRGAFNGLNEGFVEDCYWDMETAGVSEGCGSGCGAGQVTLTGLNSSDFGEESNFINWDFENIWTIATIADISPYQRPYLGIDFEVYELTLIANPEEGGQVNGSGYYMAGEEVEISAVANPVWAFENWTDESGNIISVEAETTIVIPEESTIIYANFKSTVGIDEVQTDLFSLSPNPAKNFASLNNKNGGALRLYNTNGELIIKKQIPGNYILSIGDLESGIFILSLESFETNQKGILVKP